MKLLKNTTKQSGQAQQLLYAWWGFGQLMRSHVIPSVVGKHGLDFKHFIALVTIHEGAHYPKLICERLSTTPSDVSRVLEELEAQQLIARDLDREDSRRIKLSITKLGSSMLKQAFDSLKEIIEESLEGISSSQLNVLTQTLSQLSANMRQHLDTPTSSKTSSNKHSSKRRTA